MHMLPVCDKDPETQPEITVAQSTHKKQEWHSLCVHNTLLCLKSEAQQQTQLKATLPTEINMKAVRCLQAYKEMYDKMCHGGGTRSKRNPASSGISFPFF